MMLKWGHSGSALTHYNGCPSKKRETPEMHVHREKITWGCSEVAAACKLRREASEGHQPCWHLDLTLLSSRTVRKKFILFKANQSGVFYYGSSSKTTGLPLTCHTWIAAGWATHCATSMTSGQWAKWTVGGCSSSQGLCNKESWSPKEWSCLCPQPLGSNLRQGGFA